MPSSPLPPQERKLRSLAIALSGVLLALEAVACVRGLPQAIGGHAFFRSLYDAGAAARSGRLLEASQIFHRPAWEALLFAPLSTLAYRSAYWVFFVVNLALLTLTIAWMRPYLLRLERVWKLLPAALFVCFFPVAMALIDGTDSILLMTLLTASAVSFYRERERTSGLLLGFALFDFQYTIPIALLFLLWRKWRIAGGFAVSAALLAALTAALTRFHDVAPVVRAMAGRSYPPKGAVFPLQLPNLHWMVALISGLPMPRGVSVGVTVALSVVLVAWAATRPPNFALASAVALLVSYQGLAHDLVLLVLPMSFILLSRVAQVSPREMFSKYVMGAMFVAPSLLFFVPGAEYAVGLLLLLLLIPLRSLF